MSFGAAGFLWGLAAISLPVLIHLIFRRRFRRVPWAAMEFLLRALKKTRSRLLLEHLLLMLVRMMILALLALGFAKMFLGTSVFEESIASEDRPVHLILALDDSFSMGAAHSGGQGTVLDMAKKSALDRIGQLQRERGDTISVLSASFGGQIVEGIRFSADFEAALAAVEGVKVSDDSGNLSYFLAKIHALLEEDRSPEGKGSLHPGKSIVFLTDLQQQAWLGSGKEGSEFHKMLQQVARECQRFDVIGIDPSSPRPGNLSVVGLSAAAKAVGGGLKTRFVATIRNYGEEVASGVAVDFLVDGEKKDFRDSIEVGPGAEKDISFDFTFQESGKHYVAIMMEAKGVQSRRNDVLRVDDRRFYAFESRNRIRVLLVDGDPGERLVDSEVFHLRMALSPFRREETPDDWVIRPEVVPSLPPLEKLLRMDVVVLANVGQWSEEEAESLRTLVRRGGSVLLFLGDLVRKSSYNHRLFGSSDDAFLPAPLEGPARQGVDLVEESGLHLEIEEDAYSHPIFDYFKDNERLQGLFTQTQTLNYHRFDMERRVKGSRILARFTDAARSPAILEHSYGRGKVVVVATSADRHWSFLSSSVIWVPWIHETVLYLSHRTAGTSNVAVGERFRGRYPFFTREAPRFYEVETEGNRKGLPRLRMTRRIPFDYDAVSEETQLSVTETKKAGVSRIEFESVRRTGDGGGDELVSHQDFVAVNLDRKESDLARFSPEELQETYPGVPFGKTKETGDFSAPPEESRFWWWLFLATLVLLFVESQLALLFGAKHR